VFSFYDHQLGATLECTIEDNDGDPTGKTLGLLVIGENNVLENNCSSGTCANRYCAGSYDARTNHYFSGGGIQVSKNKPCPFCGETGITVDAGESDRFLAAYCDSCGARAPQARIVDRRVREADEAAVAEWNARYDAQQTETKP